jgi:hypothetical protein
MISMMAGDSLAAANTSADTLLQMRIVVADITLSNSGQ